MECWLKLMELMSRKEDFTDPQIEEFHFYCNNFMMYYCAIYGDDWRQVTNYIHVVGAGHLTHYLRKYRNLARFQQQGWEALNQMCQKFYHQNSNHGGSEGGKKEHVTDIGKHAKPIARLVTRRNMWYFGLGEELFLCKPCSADGKKDIDKALAADIPEDILNNPNAF